MLMTWTGQQSRIAAAMALRKRPLAPLNVLANVSSQEYALSSLRERTKPHWNRLRPFFQDSNHAGHS